MKKELQILIKEIKEELVLRILNESIPRIVTCINILDEEQLWWSPNNEMNSVANLVLHLDGNIRQWFIANFQEISYTREREKEFTARKSHTKEQLLKVLSILSTDIQLTIDKININILLEYRSVQDFNVSGFSIISHIIEHTSYHTGQIAFLTKFQKNQDLGFYDDMEL